MKRIAVLGGSRFIGNHLVHALVRAGHHVTIFNRGQSLPTRELPPGIRRVRGDRDTPSSLAPLFRERYDVVYDLSGYTPAHVAPLITPRSQEQIGHYVFCSTSLVYLGPANKPLVEADPLDLGCDTYGGRKANAEAAILEASAASRWPVTILRPQGVFGSLDGAQPAAVLVRLLQRWPVVLTGALDARMNLLWVDDFLQVLLKLIDYPPSQARIYNVAGDDITNQRELVAACGRAAFVDPDIRSVGTWPYRNLPIGLVWPANDMVLATGRVRRDLGITFTPLRDALEPTLQWLREELGRLPVRRPRGELWVRPSGRVPGWARLALWIDDISSGNPLRAALASAVRTVRGSHQRP